MPAVSADSSSHSNRRRPIPRLRWVGRTASSTRCARSSPNSIIAKPASAVRSAAVSTVVSRLRIAAPIRAGSYFHGRPCSICSRDITAIAWASRGTARRSAIADWLMRGNLPQRETNGLRKCRRLEGEAEMSERYDAIVIGAGQAGPALAARLDREGLKTAFVERKLLGGTCVNNGCVPTKTLVASARAAHMARRGADYGFSVGKLEIDMAAIKRRKDGVVKNSTDALAH